MQPAAVTDPIGLNRCDVFYINLDHRTDRRTHIEGEFAKIGLKNYTRFSAIKDENGALGCARSHLQVLRTWKATSQRLLMICEDDCLFLLERSEIDDLVDQFFNDTRLDVLCLGYNARNGVAVSNAFSITSNTQTTSCYLVKQHALFELIDAANLSANKLTAGQSRKSFAIDVTWKHKQAKIFFAITNNRCVKQLDSYSDIEMQEISYKV